MKRVSLGGVLLGLILLGWSCSSFRRGKIFLIPADYVGWVVVIYEAKGSPPLEVEDGKFLIRVPVSGIVRTSSPAEKGYGQDEFFYMDEDGRTQELPGGIMADEPDAVVHSWTFRSGSEPKSLFFVGPRELVESHSKPSAWTQ